MQGIRTPAEEDTTFEPLTGNGWPGAPVKASMSGFACKATKVEPWNTKCLYPTPDFVRGGLFCAFPKKKEEIYYGKRKPVHL